MGGRVFFTRFLWIYHGDVDEILCGSLHFYIPLLTMGLISRELSTGSIKLLYSSPISNAQIVLGRFLSTVYVCRDPVRGTFVVRVCRGQHYRGFSMAGHIGRTVGNFPVGLYLISPSDCSCRSLTSLPVCGGVGYVPVVGLVISRGRLVAGV